MAFVASQGVEALAAQELEHTCRMYDRLENGGARLYTARPGAETAVPLLSVGVDGCPSEQAAAYLARQDVAVRAGLHCAPLAHRHFGTLEQGTVRLAPSVFTTRTEIDRVCKIFCEYVKMQGNPLQTGDNVVK